GMSARLAGVVGWPVAHSLSPAIHCHWLQQLSINGAYVALPIMPENFERCVTALPLMGFAGVNVTVPHKRAAVALSDQLDEDARTTGAVNMLTFTGGTCGGSNTDVHGFFASLQESLPVQRLKTGAALVHG